MIQRNTQPDRLFSSDLFPITSLGAISILLFFLNLGVPPFRNLETKWAEITREMVQSGDYMTPTINGAPYLDKPNLSYWLMVLSAKLSGGVSELSVRIPVAVSGVLSVLLLYLLGKRLFDRRAAWMAAWILSTSYFYIFWGRSGSADTMTVCGELFALWVFVRFKDSSHQWWLYLFYASMSINSLTKGLLGFVLPLLVVFPYSLWTGRWKWLFNRTTLPAGLLAGAIYLSPFALSVWTTGSSNIFEGMLYKVYRENIQRFFDPFDHNDEPVYFYSYDIFRFFAPWSLFLPFALYRYFRPSAIRHDGLRFTMLFLVVLFVFFSLSGSRRSYYILPAVPAAALLVGQWWGDLTDRENSGAIRASIWFPFALFWLILVAAALLLLMGPSLPNGPLPRALERFRGDMAAIEWPPFRVGSAAVLILLVIGSAVCAARARWRVVFLSSALAVTFCFAYYAAAVLPIEARYLTARPFDRAVRAHTGPGREIIFYRFTNTREVYYVDPPIHYLRDEERLVKMTRDEGASYLLTHDSEVPRLLKILPEFRVVLTEPYQPFRGRKDKLLVFLEKG